MAEAGHQSRGSWSLLRLGRLVLALQAATLDGWAGGCLPRRSWIFPGRDGHADIILAPGLDNLGGFLQLLARVFKSVQFVQYWQLLVSPPTAQKIVRVWKREGVGFKVPHHLIKKHSPPSSGKTFANAQAGGSRSPASQAATVTPSISSSKTPTFHNASVYNNKTEFATKWFILDGGHPSRGSWSRRWTDGRAAACLGVPGSSQAATVMPFVIVAVVVIGYRL